MIVDTLSLCLFLFPSLTYTIPPAVEGRVSFGLSENPETLWIMHYCYHAAAGPLLQWNGLKAWKIYQLVSIKEVATALPATLHTRESPLIRTGGQRECARRGRWKSGRGTDSLEKEERYRERERESEVEAVFTDECILHNIFRTWNIRVKRFQQFFFFLGQTSHTPLVSSIFSLMSKLYWGHQMLKRRQSFT